jgi:hypothetical protein
VGFLPEFRAELNGANFLALSWRAGRTRLARVVAVSSPPLKQILIFVHPNGSKP